MAKLTVILNAGKGPFKGKGFLQQKCGAMVNVLQHCGAQSLIGSRGTFPDLLLDSTL